MSGERVSRIRSRLPTTSLKENGAHSRAKGLRLAERRMLLVGGDLLTLSIVLLIVLTVKFPGLGIPFKPQAMRFIWWLVLWVVWLPIATSLRLYDPRQVVDTPTSTATATLLAGFTSLVYLVVPIVSAPLTQSRLAWAMFALLCMALMALWRTSYGRLVSERLPERRVLVLGAGASGAALAGTIDGLGEGCGVELVGFVEDDPSAVGKDYAGRVVLGDSTDLERLLTNLQIDEIVVANDDRELSTPLLCELSDAWGQGIGVIPVQLYYEQLTGSVMVEHLGQGRFALMSGSDYSLSRLWDFARRIIDIVVGIVGLAIVAPLTPLIALAIYIESPGPIFYFQERVGLAGRIFRLAKFRSMVPDAERNGAVWAAAHDDRITRVGRILRKARIDEWPQLWNLLNGTMTLIGPRPERPEFVRELTARWPCYVIRQSVKPGLTGWAQVKYRYGNCPDDALIKLQYDLYYVKHRGVLLDVVILLQTVRVVLAFEGI